MTATPVDDMSTWIDAYKVACGNRDHWSEIADRAKQQIIQRLDKAGADTGTINGREAVKWTHVTTNRIDTKALKDKDPELAARYTVTSESRRFGLVKDET